MFDWFKAGVKKKPASVPVPRMSSVGEGFQALQNGQLALAKEIFDAHLQADPGHSDALYMRGLIDNLEGRKDAAVARISQAIAADGKMASYHLSLGSLQGEMGAHEDAVRSFQAALALDPEDAETHCALGSALLQAQHFRSAQVHLLRTVQQNPAHALAQFNLGVVWQALGNPAEALQCYEAALAHAPANADAHNNKGVLLHARADYAGAIACFRRALQVRPGFVLACINLGVSLQASKRVDEAIGFFQQALAWEPQNFSACSHFALALREQGRVEESYAASQAALAISPDLAERMRMATLTPVIAASARSIQVWREKFALAANALLTEPGTVQDPLREIGACNFNLAYQPECNKRLQELTARMLLAHCPSLQYQAAHCGVAKPSRHARTRIGFLSKFMYQHSIGRTTRGLLDQLDRTRFEVIALFVPPLVDDAVSQFIRGSADSFHLLPGELPPAQQMLADLELDILFYQDIGMDAYSYYLAFARLAPVQCVSFGHPDTTGIPTIDYWVSSALFETDAAPSHYSEKLFLLHGLGTLAYYYKPALPSLKKTKSDFGLEPSRNIYLCPQALFKIHPDFDPLLGAILEADPGGEIVLIEAASVAWTQALRQRLQVTLPALVHRIRFAPRLSEDDFLQLIAVSDVMLDTLYFNGMNTSLEAFAVGTPVVTLPSHMQRGRHTAGMYRRMGLEECIADTAAHYTDIAVRLGTDARYRRAVQAQILERNAVLYEDAQVVREFERFFSCAQEAAQTAARDEASATPKIPG